MAAQGHSQESAQPVYVLRGHASQVHALHFFRNNTKLVTGDADGWVVVWKVASRRPVAVWKAHHATILAVNDWDNDKIITHGRDNKLFVWKFTEEDEASLEIQLPVEIKEGHNRKPWLLYSLDVNALNFCAFSMCLDSISTGAQTEKACLVAVPSSLDSNCIDIYSLPSSSRISAAVGRGNEVKTGMAMTTSLVSIQSMLTLLVGFESGHARVYQQRSGHGDISSIAASDWRCIYSYKAHSQPILSLDYLPNSLTSSVPLFITSSADAIVAEHPIPKLSASSSESNVKNNLRTINTHHAGQQSLVVRSDGRILATAGWDARIRVYSAKTLKELAVLKWHREGCYAVAFAEVIEHDAKDLLTNAGSTEIALLDDMDTKHVPASSKSTGMMLNAEMRRIDKAANMHWLAAGSKDGKISLWEIY